jgi:radical SAM protein with 4Fe4S-binding SPASM domain
VAPEKELESWARRWSPKLDADRGDILLNTTVHNWSGARASAGLHLPEAERYCSWPFKAIQIQWDGTVSPCCFDYDGSVRLGDVKTNTVKEVWTGERFEAFRRPWRERKSYSIPLCRNCDAPDGRYRTERLPDVLQPGSRGVVKRPRLSDGSSETHSRSSGAPGWALDEDFSGNEGE